MSKTPTSTRILPITRRTLLKGAAAGTAVSFIPTRFAIGQAAKIKVGLMVAYSGAFSGPGVSITEGFKLRLNEIGGKIAGREVEYVQLDDESAPPKAKDNAARLIQRDKVDVLVGSTHSGVAEAMVAVAREEGTFTICPNAGAASITGQMCAPNIFRSSFSNWQPAFPCGKVMVNDGHKKAVMMSWNYPAGHEATGGFKENFVANGGTVVKEIFLDFPKVEFQAYLTEIASIKPDAVFVFFAGAGALKFIQDYAAAGLQGKIPLYGSGFITDGVLKQAGAAAEGIKSTLHYADALDNPMNKKFRPAFKAVANKDADVYAVQGYDAATMLIKGVEAVKGDLKATKTLYAAIAGATIESPRGNFTLGKNHNPIQDIYLRQVKGGEEVVLGVAHKALADPGKGCSMM
ncbi:MAG: ABC transporter substrate-binding protein [Rhodospirillales bacterium]|nr:ABC transporter substrate-binding protein [Rhodospirillales bacterium]